jgi:hypothetical protein
VTKPNAAPFIAGETVRQFWKLPYPADGFDPGLALLIRFSTRAIWGSVSAGNAGGKLLSIRRLKNDLCERL